MSPTRVLVAGIGNVFLGDDGFGSEVAQRLLRQAWPEGVRVVDYGIRGIDLAYALLDGCETAILIDAVPRGEPPGTLFVLEPESEGEGGPGESEGSASEPLLEGHGLDPATVLRLVSTLGGRPPQVIIVGCEPMPMDDGEDPRMELSPRVRAAVEEAIPLVEELITWALAGGGSTAAGWGAHSNAQERRT